MFTLGKEFDLECFSHLLMVKDFDDKGFSQDKSESVLTKLNENTQNKQWNLLEVSEESIDGNGNVTYRIPWYNVDTSWVDDIKRDIEAKIDQMLLQD